MERTKADGGPATGALEILALIGAGAVIGLYAQAVGAGGGFLLSPFLLLWHDGAEPAEVTMAALLIVAVSSGISTVLSLRRGLVDLPVGMLLLVAAAPAALLGALANSQLPREAFASIFAVLLVMLGLYLIARPEVPTGKPGGHGWRRDFTDSRGQRWFYRVPLARGIGLSSGVACVAALAGVGGGRLYTPLNTHVLRMPHTLAIPATHLVITGLAGVVVIFHAGSGTGGNPLEDVLPIGLGVIAASRFGDELRRRLRASLLTRFLAIGLLIIGGRAMLEAL